MDGHRLASNLSKPPQPYSNFTYSWGSTVFQQPPHALRAASVNLDSGAGSGTYYKTDGDPSTVFHFFKVSLPLSFSCNNLLWFIGLLRRAWT